MDISKLFESRQGDLIAELKIALVCVICAVLPYYISIHTIGYPYRKFVMENYYFYEVIFRDALGEEALYRLIPLTITIQLFGIRWWMISVVIICTGTYFALIHNGYPSLYALGPGSILLALAFLYYGGLKGDYLRGFMWCSGIHIAINLIVNTLFPLLL